VIGVGLPPVVLRIVGTPRPQGSKQKLGTKFYREGGSAVADGLFKDWRSAVAAEGIAWLRDEHYPAPVTGPVRIDMLFLLSKPQSRPKKELLPFTAHDRDKLERAIHDGLSPQRGKTAGAPVIANDSRVCFGHVGKLWAVDTSPGCVVRITALAPDDWVDFPLVDLVWPERAALARAERDRVGIRQFDYAVSLPVASG
jgi:Holliday junction resolvase RusA-like endonuclease